MGAFLDRPETTKHTEKGQTPFDTWYGLSSMQGWRVNMEDAHFVHCNHPQMPDSVFAAVFDGHGGSTISIAGAEKLAAVLVQNSKFKTAYDSKDAEALADVLKESLIQLDKELYHSDEGYRNGTDRSGSTLVCCIVTKDHIIVANCGDSRLVYARNGKSVFGTKDHKPSDPSEVARIKAAGGFVEMGRVCGNLAVSRSLGDYEYKRDIDKMDTHKVSSVADTTVLSRQADDQFLVLACDGIWDVLSNDQVVAFVQYYLEHHRTADEICELLLDFCLDLGSRDNMSAIIILLPNAPKPLESYKRIAESESETEEYQKQLVQERKEVRTIVTALRPDVESFGAPPPSMQATTTSDMDEADDNEPEDGSVARRSSEVGLEESEH